LTLRLRFGEAEFHMSEMEEKSFCSGEALRAGERQKGKIQCVPFTRGIWLFCFSVVLALAACLSVAAQEATDDSGDEQEQNSNAGYRYLLMEVSTVVNNKGLKTTRMHKRIEIQKQHAVEAMGDVSIPYNAFRSEARVVKAFTQTADGRTVQLKKEAVHDLTPDEVSSSQMYTDVHQLTFSMPALGKGAIMDYEVEIEEKKPVMAGEFWISEYLDAGAEVRTSRVTVAFPARREVKLLATNLTTQALVTDTTNGSTRTMTWEMKNVPALEYEPGMPPFSSVRAQVHLTSVKSWQQVAEWYAGLAKKHLQADDNIQRQARSLTNGLIHQLDQIQALYRYASRDVRYVGVELGRSAYEPHPPWETMQNKYGDCKDKAALLVSLLNAAGIQAHMAIVRPNDAGPLMEGLPSPEQFNHAVVYVPCESGDLWIDATQPYGEVTEHGYHLDDVEALVVGLPGKTFVHVTVPDETHSIHRLIFDVNVHYGGLCTVHEVNEFTGRAAIDERERRSRLDADKVRKQLEHNLGSGTGYGRLLNYSFTNPTNDSEPVRVVFDYDSDTFLTWNKSGLSVRFDASELRGWLTVPRPDPTSVRKHKRRYPWMTRMAHTEEIICRLHLPSGYELAHTPTEVSKELPHGKAEMLFDKSAGFPCLTLRVIHRPARLQPRELPEVAEQVDNAISRVRASLDIEESVNDLMREHRYAKAEAAVVEAARADTNSTDALLRLGTYYKIVGRVYQSQLAFQKALALSPQNPQGYQMLANTYSGWWGILGEGVDRDSIMTVYQRALTNVPVRAWTIYQQAAVCLIGELGRGDSTNRLDVAEGYFRELLKEDAQSYKGLLGLGQINRLRGNYDEAEDYYRKAARVKANQVEPRTGLWISMAYAGRDEEAWNAMAEYYGTGQQMNSEVIRVTALLMASRHYETAARLYDRLVESATRPEALQKLARLLRKTEKVKRDGYENFYDDSTPEATAQTLVIAGLMGDVDKVFRCLSPAVNRAEARRLIETQESLLNAVKATLGTNYFADVVLSGFEVSRRTLDDGVVEVKLDASRSGVPALSAFGSVLTMQLQAVSNRWEAITMNAPEVDCATLGRLALEALGRGDIPRAIVWQTRLADLIGHPGLGRPTPPIVVHLQEIAFTNDILRVKAWAGLGLSNSHDRADKIRAADCLEDVVAAYPEDAELKILLAFGCHQLANVRKATAILETIDSTKLAVPDALCQLAWMLVSLEKLDAADKVLARLREVAPDNDKLPVLQSEVLTYRGKYSEAASTVAKLHESSKLDSPAFIPDECRPISLSGDKAMLGDIIEHWREPEKPIGMYRPTISDACLALDLPDEASEQIATMLAEGGANVDAVVSYAEIALIRGNTAEARHLVSVADRIANRYPEAGRLKGLSLVHLALGDPVESARIYCEEGTREASHYSGYYLCFSALASRLAGDTTTSAETLKQAAALQGDSDWPRMAIQYVKGDISEDEFRQAPERTTHTPFMRGSRECEVNCIVGLLKESNHDLPGALAAYQASVATKSVTDLEYMIARLALKRLRDTHPGRVEDTQAGTRATSRL
jgi:tetratricopeptide (TPR) repeat protein/transglutaminase-like putative cysteine protease